MTKLPRTRSRLVVVAAAAAPILGALALTVSTADASPAPAKHATGGVGQAVPASVQAATHEYWTPARRAAAKNAEVVSATAPSSIVSPAVSSPDGPRGVREGSPPSSGPSSSGTASEPGMPMAFSYPFPYDEFPVPTSLYKKYPYSVNGTIYFRNNGGGFKCSGTSVVNGHQPSEVWTAGHCTANTAGGNKFDESAEFIPAYNGSKKGAAAEPFGSFVAHYYYTSNAWLKEGDVADDYGVMLVNENAKGQTLSAAVGTDGFEWNASENRQFVTFGYPGEAPYNGKLQYEDIGATGASASVGEGPQLTGIGSPLTGGSSGGAWDVNWTPTGPGRVNGHNDWKFFSQPEAMYSPYYDSLTEDIYCLGNTGAC